MSNQHFSSGTLTYNAGANVVPFGTGGLLDTIRSKILGTEVTDEVLYSGDGVTTSFSGQALAETPCGLGRLILTYTVDTDTYTASDDGAGQVLADEDGAVLGQVDYDTGDVGLEFSDPPDNGTDILASYLYGEPGEDWRELLYQDSKNKDGSDAAFGGDCKEWIIHNTGKSGQENVIIGFREWWYAAGDGGGLNVNVYTAWPSPDPVLWNFNETWNNCNTYQTTWKTFQKHPTLPLPYRGTVSYFLYSNRHRVVLVAKIGSQYESLYLGFGRRFGSPSSYPHPLVCNTTHHHQSGTFYNYTYTAGAWRRYCAAGYPHADNGYPLMIVLPDDSYESGNSSTGLTLIPYDNYGATGVIEPTPGQHRVMMTPTYVGHITNSVVYLDLDGVYHVAASSIASEDELYYGRKLHTVFQNVHRTTDYDFMAVEQEDFSTTTSSTTSTTTSSTTSTTTS